MSSRKDEKEQRRQERLARESVEAQQAKRRRLYGTIVGTVLSIAAVGAIVAVIAAGGGDSSTTSGGKPQSSFPDAATVPVQNLTDLDQAAQAANCVLRNPSIEGRTHVPDSTKVTYGTKPPTSGNHNAVPAEDGYYAKAPSARHTLHTLEHGRVYIHYKPTLDKRQIDQLGGLFNDDPYHMVLSPDSNMPYQLAVTAWGHVAGCKKVNDETFDVIRAFRERYRDKGPETVP